MPDESRPSGADPIIPVLSAIHDELTAFRKDTHGRLSHIEKRVSNLEQMQRWALGIMIGTLSTLVLAMLGLYFRR